MLLSLVLHTYSMRYVVLLGTAPTYMLAWGVWRLLSAFLPAPFYQAVDDRLYCIYQRMVLFFFENYTGVQILLYGDLPENKENIIYLANHQSTVDWIVADVLAIRQNALGHVRYVLKDRLKWLPLYGCYFPQHGGIYVKRSAKFNEKEMRNKLQSYVNTGTPMYLAIFPEGTRYNPRQTKLLSAGQAFAAQKGFAVLKHVLTPRIKATYVAFDSMKNYLDAIYDVTVVYEGKDDRGQQCPKIHNHIDHIDKKDVPENQEYMRRWLHERFEIKDKLFIEFYDSPDPERRNKFPGKSRNVNRNYNEIPSHPMLLRMWIKGTLWECKLVQPPWRIL
uniref:Phospholipid/glycerol acyltransferase domain-containing protein n=1 Tax=Propithecus coquereli TaxID=379532 RepID=A0A2K6GXD6_PROCO